MNLRDSLKHFALVKRQCFAVLKSDPLNIEAFHRVHLARVYFSAAKDLAKAASS